MDDCSTAQFFHLNKHRLAVCFRFWHGHSEALDFTPEGATQLNIGRVSNCAGGSDDAMVCGPTQQRQGEVVMHEWHLTDV
jgi:hypothetical protein